jgi:hypothetical protein
MQLIFLSYHSSAINSAPSPQWHNIDAIQISQSGEDFDVTEWEANLVYYRNLHIDLFRRQEVLTESNLMGEEQKQSNNQLIVAQMFVLQLLSLQFLKPHR